jgi:hypothetical protein
LTAPRAHLRNNHPKILAARLGCAIAASQLSTIDLGVAIVVTHKFAAASSQIGSFNRSFTRLSLS